MKGKFILYLILVVSASLLLLPLLGGGILAQTPTVTGTPESTEATAMPPPTAERDELILERTPEPTATPDAITRAVNMLTVRAGMTEFQFLGLNSADWINLGISAAIAAIAYLIGTWLIHGLLPRVVRRTPTKLDDALLANAGADVRSLVVLLALQLATMRLTFLSAEVKSLLADAYFAIGLLLSVRILWRLIDLAHDQYRERLVQKGRAEELDPALILLVRLGRIVLVAIGLIVLLSYFGVNVTGLTAALGIAGLAFSLAAQDTLADAIAGFLILADRPFRVGDRIEIQGEGTWGDVVEIGLRTTRIRTRDNRMVIVPNSIIGKSQVVNYSYPDPVYRIETHVGIAYGTDVELVRQVIVDAVRLVPGILADRPVDALYIEMGPSAMVFRIRLWIESYVDTRRVIDRVHTALQQALDGAGIVTPYPTQNLNVWVEPNAATRLPQPSGG